MRLVASIHIGSYYLDGLIHLENTFKEVVLLLYQQMIHTAGQNKHMPSMSFLSVKVVVLVLAWLQLLYLTNSLVARVNHCASSRKGRQLQQKQWDNNDGNSIHNHHSIVCGTTRSSDERLFRQRHAVGAAASTTALSSSSTDNNNNNSIDDDGTSSSSPPIPPSPRSLIEILEELTNRGIAFSPLASRAELEELLDSLEERHPSPGPKKRTITTTVSSMPSKKNMGDDSSSEAGSKRNRQQPRQEQQQQRQREIEDRIQRRANRTRCSSSTSKENLGEERIYDDNDHDDDADADDSPPSPTSRQGRQRQRQRRQEGERRGPRESIQSDYYSEDEDYFESAVVGGGEDSDGTRLRRRRRRQRLEQEPPSLLDSISSNLPVTEIVGIGARASRIARKKTGKLWKDIVDSTYYDDDDDDDEMMYEKKYSDTGFRQSQRQSRPSRRERRRSGFNWQPQQPSRLAREVGGSQRQRRRRRSESASGDVKTPSTDYYTYSDEKEPVIGREESLQRQKREQRRESRQRQQQQQQHYDDRKNQNEPVASTTRSRMDSFAKTTRGKLSTNGKLPINQILAALDQRNISFSPSASRKELEDLLMNGLDNNNDVVAVKKAEEDAEVVIEVDWISPEDWKKQQEAKLQQKQKEQERDKEQKQQQHQANSKSTGEKPNPRPEPPKGGTSTISSSTSNFYRRSVNNSYRPSGFSVTTAKAYGTGASARKRRRRQTQPGPTPRTAAAAAASSPPSENFSGSNTSGADASESTIRSSASRRKTAPEAKVNEGKVPRTSQTSRRIYSPFGGGQGSESTETTSANTRSSRRNKKKNDFVGIEDDLDRFVNVIEDDVGKFGDFLANSVDNVFWGTAHDDEIESTTPSPSNRNTGREDHEPSNRRKRKRHWKDRAEERLDKVLGVHKVGGKTYNRWVEKEATDAEEDEARGYDAVSYTKGRKRKRSTKKRKAFWEEDESIMSVLLGHNWNDSRPPQRSLRSNLDDIREAFRSGNTLTVLLRNLLVVSARIVESLCNWASVRDTIPRPVVFLGALGTGFVSRPGDRIKNTLLAFLSVRVLGEWLSGPDRRDNRARPRKDRASDVPRNDEDDDDDK